MSEMLWPDNWVLNHYFEEKAIKIEISVHNPWDYEYDVPEETVVTFLSYEVLAEKLKPFLKD